MRDEQELIRRIALNDEPAMVEFHSRTHAFARRLAFRVLRDHSAAEEVASDALLQVWRSAAQYDPARGSPAMWLAMITKSRAIDRARSARRRTENELDSRALFLARSSAPGPEYLAAEAQMIVRMRSEVNRLPAKQRQAVELNFYRELPHAEVAKRMARPLGSTKTSLRAALQVLRVQMTSAV